jgi:hypothetical protein
MMGWRKRGLLIEPPTDLPWVASHAAVPHVDLEGGVARIYFTTRDAQRRSHIACATMTPAGGDLRADVHPEPVLRPGRRGTFDDSGAMTSCLVRRGGREYLYYQGWSLGVTVPFYVLVGCATREDGGDLFARTSEAPVVGRNSVDPIMVSSPWVLFDEGRWRMWYVSNLGWMDDESGRARYRVHIRYAESDDGLDWRRDGRVCIDFLDGEHAISRPCVMKDGDRYRMWYSYRGESYRIGYAESGDGLTWARHDGDAGIDVSAEGWDSEMVEYACVFDLDDRRYMLYNGNGFGATGIGYAELDG